MKQAETSSDKTFRIEQNRAWLSSLMDSAETTFFMFIAIRIFDASPLEKSLIAGGGNLGLLLTPWVVYHIAKSRMELCKAISMGYLVCAAAMLAAGAWWTPMVYLLGVVGSLIALRSIVPAYTELYARTYAPEQRGNLFAKNAQIRILTSGLAALAVGWSLDWSLDFARWLILLIAASMFLQSIISLGYPDVQMPRDEHPGLFRAFRHVKEDATFLWILVGWMFLGVGNLMMIPLRVEYLAHARYGIEYSPALIAWLTVFIPCLSQLVFIRIWGMLFDKISFFLLRILINFSIITSIILFFLVGTFETILVASVFNGISMSGASIAWSLWVTKVAKPEDVADYMSVHTFLTGVRGLIAPFLAFYMATVIGMAELAWISLTLIVIASLMHIPEIRSLYKRRAGKPLTQDIPD